MPQHDDDAINEFDLVSIVALVEHLAHEKKFNRENAYRLLEAEFNVPNYKKIKRCDVDRAKAFLVDLHDITVH